MTIEELPIPTLAKEAKKSMEIGRVWIVDKKPVFVITPNLWKDPVMWGMLLVDFARQVSLAYQREGNNQEKVLNRIKQGFDAEWTHPTEY